jgi:RNA polymerase sigma factor (sigma-70 family)
MHQLIAEAKAGSRKAEEQLFQILRARFRTIAKRRVLEKETAEDVVQDACLTVLEKYKTEEFHSGFEPWAYQVLRMKIGNYLQSKKTQKKKFNHEVDVMDISSTAIPQSNQDLETMLIDCLRKIARASLRYARVLSFSYQGYKADEICKRMRVTKNSLYSILCRSRSLLNQCLDTGQV